jgi:hypothetical protein
MVPSHLGGGLWHAGTGRRGFVHGDTEALELVEQTGVRWYEAETYRVKGTLLLHQAVPDAAQAEACFQQSLDIARVLIAEQDGTSIKGHGLMLTQDKGTPTREHPRQALGRGRKEPIPTRAREPMCSRV